MRRKQNNIMFAYYAKILFVISITFFSYGCFLQFYSNSKLIDPIKDVVPITSDEVVSVTPADGVLPTDLEDNGSTSENRKQDIEQSTIIDTPSIDEENIILKNEIENIYGIQVLYGKDVKGYMVMSEGSFIRTETLVNPYVINKQLMALRDVLELYPKDIFKEIRDGGIPLTVILIKQYSDKRVTGITDSSNNYAKISIASIYPFDESFYHESYHYIERYLFKKGAAFNSWDSFNPPYFKWGTIYNDLAYSYTFSEQVPFVNTYAQSSPAEDRASTFEYMMASSKASCLNSGTTIWTKADYMSKTIRYVLKSVQKLSHNQVRWERYLY